MTIFVRYFLILLMMGVPVTGSINANAQSKGNGAKILRIADKALKQKKYALAVRKYTEALDLPGAGTGIVSHALYRRAIAYRLSGRHAKSIADTTNALWLGKLTNRQKAEALNNRALAYDATGFRTKAAVDRKAVANLGGAPVGVSKGVRRANAAKSSFTTTTKKSAKRQSAVSKNLPKKVLKEPQSVPSFRTTIQPENSAKKETSGSTGFLSGLFSGSKKKVVVKSKPVKSEDGTGLSASDWSKATKVNQ